MGGEARAKAWQGCCWVEAASLPGGWAPPRAALMTPSSPGCSQTPLFLGFLEPARPSGVSST